MKIHELINEAVGPAEGRELELMLKGVKPNSIIMSFQWTPEWAQAAAKNGWTVIKAAHPESEAIIISRKAGDAQSIKTLLTGMWNTGIADAAYHTKLGRLLGYSSQDIAHFLKNMGLEQPSRLSTLARGAGTALRTGLGALGNMAKAATGPAAFLGTYSSDLNQGEDEEMARIRAQDQLQQQKTP